MIDSDIAVIEYRDDLGEWKPLAYIGPDRSDGKIEDYYDCSNIYRGCDLRITYLNAYSRN